MKLNRIMTAALISLPSLMCASLMKNPAPTIPAETQKVVTIDVAEPGEALSHCVPAIIPQYAGVSLQNGLNVFGTAQFLWWNQSDNFQSIVRVNQNNASNSKKELSIETTYRPGFKVGLGAEFLHFDQWNAYLEYTYYHPSWTNHNRARGGETLQSLAGAIIHFFTPDFGLPGYVAGKYKLSIKYDAIEAFLGRPIYIGQRLTFDAGFGIQGVTLKRHIRDVYTRADGIQDFIVGTYKSWSIGPAGMMNGKWLLGNHFCLLGDTKIGFLYNRATKYTTDCFVNPVAPFFPGQITNSKFAKPEYSFYILGEAGTGLGWGKYLNRNRYYFDLGALFDVTALFIHDGNGFVFPQMFLWGLTLQGRFDF